mgnify:CR=1 FL=1
MKKLTSQDWIWIVITFVLSAIIGPFGFIPVFIAENKRRKKGEIDTLITDRFADCTAAMLLGVCVWVAVATSIVN